ncbi:MAG: hypothetical protein AB7N71_15410 [Phycisphaerae bacterium]
MNIYVVIGIIVTVALIAGVILAIGRLEWKKPSDDRLPYVPGNSHLMKPDEHSRDKSEAS